MDQLTQMEQRMLFYAGLMRNGKPAMDPQLLELWRRALRQWVNDEYAKIEKGGLPTRGTPKNVLGKEGWEIASHALEDQSSVRK